MADAELLPCPFCGGAARIESNRDWHRIYAAHEDECVFDADDHALMYPAQPGYLIQIAEDWNRRATPPLPSTAPEVDERAAFEAWARDPIRAEKLPLDRWPTNGAYKDTRTYIAFYGWKSGRAALASRPDEVDDEGLPPLPDQYVGLSPFPGRKYFTAEQYRQGQRDAVAAYRAAKEFCDKNCLSYRREPGCSMGKLCVSEP